MMLPQQRRNIFWIAVLLIGINLIAAFWYFKIKSAMYLRISKTEVKSKPIDHHNMSTEALSSTGRETSSEFKVPNVVHYIWYNNDSIEFRFDKAISVLSAIKYIRPDAVYFHTNTEPKGPYYDMLKEIPIFKVVKREPPKKVLKTIYHDTDYSDFDKVKILIEQGGIYLDLDVMVIKSFDDLRRYPCTLGFELEHRVCSGVIVCTKEHPFLYLWLNSYYEDFRKFWAHNSGTVSSRLVHRYPDIIHIEETKLHVPNYQNVKQIWGEIYDWKDNYAMHTWIRVAYPRHIKPYPTPESIKTMNTTYGQMARAVFYGSPELINE